MADKKGITYRYERGNQGYVTFDSEGYIVEAKGFGSLMWTKSPDIDKDLVGKHVDELSDMLKNHASARDVYYAFESVVHVDLLKQMLKNLNQ